MQKVKQVSPYIDYTLPCAAKQKAVKLGRPWLNYPERKITSTANVSSKPCLLLPFKGTLQKRPGRLGEEMASTVNKKLQTQVFFPLLL